MLAATAALTGPALADHEQARMLREQGEIQSLEALITDAKARYPGELLEAELEYEDGRYLYEIELVDEHGLVREIYYDAKTGELVRVQGEP